MDSTQYNFLLVNSMVKHALQDGFYNQVRADMEAALGFVNAAEGRGGFG